MFDGEEKKGRFGWVRRIIMNRPRGKQRGYREHRTGPRTGASEIKRHDLPSGSLGNQNENGLSNGSVNGTSSSTAGSEIGGDSLSDDRISSFRQVSLNSGSPVSSTGLDGTISVDPDQPEALVSESGSQFTEQDSTNGEEDSNSTRYDFERTPRHHVQILESERSGRLINDGDSGSTKSVKRRSNSNFTVPSVSRTSITTIAPSLRSMASEGSQLPNSTSQSNNQHNHPMDNASIITIASSSKWHRRSFDTNASTKAIAPESLLGGSVESLPLTSTPTAKSTKSAMSALSGLAANEPERIYYSSDEDEKNTSNDS